MELTYDEAKAVITDKNNQFYERYHRNDRDVNDAVSRAYLKQFPGEYDTSDKTPAALRTPPEKAGASEVAGPEAASEIETILKAELGSNYDATINDAVAGLGEFFNTAEDFEAAVNSLNLNPAQQAAGVKWLAERGRNGK